MSVEKPVFQPARRSEVPRGAVGWPCRVSRHGRTVETPAPSRGAPMADDLRRLLDCAVRTELRATVAVTTLVIVLAGYLLACGAAPSVPLWLPTSGTTGGVAGPAAGVPA